jgi:hypothetical protein
MENNALPTRRRFLRKIAVSTFLAPTGTAAYTWRIGVCECPKNTGTGVRSYSVISRMTRHGRANSF